MKYYIYYPPELYHHGVKGMHWGVRRYQNYDGTRIGSSPRKKVSDSAKKIKSNNLSGKNPEWYRSEYKKAGFSKEEINKSIKELRSIKDAARKDENIRDSKHYYESEYGLDGSKTKDEYLSNRLADHKKYLEDSVRTRQEWIDKSPDGANTSFWKKWLKEDQKELDELSTSKGEENYKKYWGKVYDDVAKEYKKLGSPSDRSERDAVIKTGREETKPLLNDLKSKKYGSDEWFEAREKYYKASDSYTKAYADATLKDLGKTNVSEITKEYMYSGEEYVAPLLGNNSYAYSDYKNITDPVRNTRDYGLEEKYDDWYARTHK